MNICKIEDLKISLVKLCFVRNLPLFLDDNYFKFNNLTYRF